MVGRVLRASEIEEWMPGCSGVAVQEDLFAVTVPGFSADQRVLPAFADPERWTGMMRASIRMATERFSSDRMVQEYFARLYSVTSPSR